MNPPAVPSPAPPTPANPTPVNKVLPPARRPLDPRSVNAVLAAIRTDSLREPETFLKDTVVPHGGE